MKKAYRQIIGELMEKHMVSMQQLTYRRVGQLELAEDLVQETFLTACFKAQKVCEHEKPIGWLYETLNYLTLREMARARYTAEMPMLDADILGIPDIELSVEDVLPSELTDMERTLLIMRIDQGLSFENIAEHYGISEPTCRQRVARAMRRCRELMEPESVEQLC